ncbi:MAG TPA: aspartate ammonia-lyase [Candidatus Limiplasma sp.]|nr:aspartate ammonia-lyase [Candidatus Limiplasma sp.]HPR78256.1 aspartate ammonia-lyase [Candidatus Limiplasma sp.]
MLTRDDGWRTESDSIGSLQVPADALYGVQTLRAVENFPITGQRIPDEMIVSLAYIKKAAAVTNRAAGDLPASIAQAIITACDEIIAGKWHEQFIVDVIQGGAGTSTNMNANEVIANRAIELLGGVKGDYSLVHPNDHVNMSQSTNDVYPTCGRMTAIRLLSGLYEQLTLLKDTLSRQSWAFHNVIKIGRTQLQDAVPVRLGQTFHAYASCIERDIARIKTAEAEMHQVNLGGTAIGTHLNAGKTYVQNIVRNLSGISGLTLEPAEDCIDATQNADGYAALSGALKALAVNLSKISNDLRLMSSGPIGGFGDISLPSRQNGSSIMPGKINPVIPEVVNQIAFLVVGNDATITMAAEAGQLELNAFEPVLFNRLFGSITALTHGIHVLSTLCVQGITANQSRCRALVEKSSALATVLCPVVGYTRASALAKRAIASGDSVRQLAVQDHLVNEANADAYFDVYSMTGEA